MSFLDMCNTSRLCIFRLLNFGGNSVSRQVMNMPLLGVDVYRINITLYFLRHSHVRERDNIMWSNHLIIQLSSLFPPQPPIPDPKSAVSVSTSNSLFYL